jgi:hypothetical protein
MSEERPRRSYTKRRTDAALAFCAAVISYVLVYRDGSPIAETAITFAFLTAAALLGVYQGVGHLDLRASKKPPEQESQP